MTVSIRPLSADDETAVVEFYRRTHQDDPTVGAISVAGWRHFAAMSHNQGGRDFRAAWAGDRARDRARGRVDGVATTSQRALLVANGPQSAFRSKRESDLADPDEQ